MRHLIKYCTLIFLLIVKQLASQNSNVTVWECATELGNSSNPQLNTQSAQNCSKISSDWHTRYKLMETFIPNGASYEAVKTIPINLVIFGEDDGTQFPFHIGLDMPSMATYYNSLGIEIPNPYSTSSNQVNNFEAWLNSTNVNTSAPNNVAAIETPQGSGNFIPYNFNICNPASLPDSKIRYEIKHYYFYQNSTINNAQVTFSAYAIAENAAGNPYPMINEGSNFQHIVDGQAINLHLGLNPDAAAQVNCFLYKYFNYPGAGGWSQHGTYSSQPILYTTSASKIYEYLVDPPAATFPYGPDDWDDVSGYAFFYGHLPHELGHRLSLGHIYDSEIITPTNIDFLDDIYECINPQHFRMGNNLMGQDNPQAISPKQMGRMHRSLSTDNVWYGGAAAPARNFAFGYSTTPHEVIGNEIWDFTYKSYNDIVVKEGATLTLRCRLEMVPEASIIVERGGLLIVDGATITSARCGGKEHEGLWKGIQVWGDKDKAQYQMTPQGFYCQGRLEVRNGAIIENAEVAIQANRPDYWTYGGGIVKIVGSTIRNCWKGVHFTRYLVKSASYIKYATFETTSDLINGDVPQTFIEGWEFKGLKVNACTFRNTNPNVSSYNDLGKGIYLESAKSEIAGLTTATLTDFCDETNPDWQPNVFENLYKGVELLNFGGMQTNGVFTSTITRNFFKNCIYGIECAGMPAVTINQNKVLLGGNSVFHDRNEGILHHSNTGFIISENCISQVGNNANYTGGIVISDVGGGDNQVYRNKSYDCDHAYVSNGKNRSASVNPNSTYSGLQFLCNQNQGSQLFNLVVESDGIDPLNPMNGIRYYQGGFGNATNPFSAANIFTNGCLVIDGDVYNNTINDIIYYHSIVPQETPICISVNVIPEIATTNTCATLILPQSAGSILSQNQKNLLLADFAIKNSQYLAVSIIYNNIIDNGNTQSLLQMISTSMPTNAVELRNILLNNSPNLSNAVIQDLISENTILQNSDLLSIISANPDIAHNEEFLRMLRDKTNPMDEWMIEFLREAGTYQTNRTLLEQTFMQKQSEKDAIAWKMVRHLLNDTVSDTLFHSVLHQWLNIIGSPKAKYMIAEDYASMGNFNAALQLLNDMEERFLDRYEVSELQGVKAWFTLQSQLYSEGRNIYELTNSELNSIKQLAENQRLYGLAGTFAANVLNHYEPESHKLMTIYPDINNRSMTDNERNQKKRRTIKKLSSSKQNTTLPSAISIYPNPANNLVTVNLDNTSNVVKICLYSIKGDLILTKQLLGEKTFTLNVADIESGTYNIEFTDNKGNIIKSERLIVRNE